jgi:zinc transporter ZupT
MNRDGSPGAPDTKTRRAWRIAGLGTAVLGGGLALLALVVGGSGVDGIRFLLLGALASCSAGALYAVVTGALDTMHDREVGRDRVIAAVVLGAAVLILPVMLVGVGG